MKKENKVVYEVSYIPPKMVMLSDIMSKCDLGISAVYFKENYEITTTSEINKAYINKMKKALFEAFSLNGGRCLDVKYKNHTIK